LPPPSRSEYERRYEAALQRERAAISSATETVLGVAATLRRTGDETVSEIVFSVARMEGYRFGTRAVIWSDQSPPDVEPELMAAFVNVDLIELLDARDLGLPERPEPGVINWLGEQRDV
jgi:hypothetical protein